MDITPSIPKNRNVINGYGQNNFKINEAVYNNSIVLSPDQLLEVKIKSLEDLDFADLKNIFGIIPEILLIGTGPNHQDISDHLKNQIKQLYPETDVSTMTTGSACRTYNILMMEDRNVVAVLLIING